MDGERSDDAGSGRGRRSLAFLIALLPVLSCAAGCARQRPPARPQSAPLAAQVYADTGRGGRLSVRLPVAHVWLARVTPARAEPPEPVAPEAAPESLPTLDDTAPALEADAGLKPPVLRAPAPACLRQAPVPPGGRRAVAGWVDLDVRVDEAGAVSEALWMAGSADTALTRAALRCALSMRFYPALRAGRPVSVWCRQRFDFRVAAR
jgi:outer membrane biosynthesis protein TonB